MVAIISPCFTNLYLFVSVFNSLTVPIHNHMVSIVPRGKCLGRRAGVENCPVIGVHKRVDNPGTARMQLEQRMLQIGCYIQAVRKVAKGYEQGGWDGDEEIRGWSELRGINITKMGRSELRIEFPNHIIAIDGK